jgi:hypothetical protein
VRRGFPANLIGKRYAMYDLRQANVREALNAFRRKYLREPVAVEIWEPWRNNPAVRADKQKEGPRWLLLAI